MSATATLYDSPPATTPPKPESPTEMPKSKRGCRELPPLSREGTMYSGAMLMLSPPPTSKLEIHPEHAEVWPKLEELFSSDSDGVDKTLEPENNSIVTLQDAPEVYACNLLFSGLSLDNDQPLFEEDKGEPVPVQSPETGS